MTKTEALMIKSYLDQILKPGSKVVDIGSSTHFYRTVQKPHIFSDIYKPIGAAESTILAVDFKQGEGIDISGSIFEAETQARISREKPNILLCNNLAEHVDDKSSLLEILAGFGCEYIIFSVPFDYPYHKDPIDNLYRPGADELALVFDGYDLAEHRLVSSGTFLDSLNEVSMHRALSRLLKEFIRIFLWIITLNIRNLRYSRLLWLAKPYKTSVALYRKKL